jgi:hypothetical protein
MLLEERTKMFKKPLQASDSDTEEEAILLGPEGCALSWIRPAIAAAPEELGARRHSPDADGFLY